MSKRKPEVQGSGRETSFAGDGSEFVEPMDRNVKATAAQLASRKIKQARPRSRLITAGATSASTNSGPQNGQTPGSTTPSVPSVLDSQVPSSSPSNPFQFAIPPPPIGQPAQQSSQFVFSSTQPLQAKEKPPAVQSTFGGSQSFSFAPPSSDFSFNSPTTQMSFNTGIANGTSSGGFSGSIFNFAAPEPKSTQPPSQSPLFSTGLFGQPSSTTSQPLQTLQPSTYQFASTVTKNSSNTSPTTPFKFGGFQQSQPPVQSAVVNNNTNEEADITMASASPETTPQKGVGSTSSPRDKGLPSNNSQPQENGPTEPANGTDTGSVLNTLSTSADAKSHFAQPTTTSPDKPEVENPERIINPVGIHSQSSSRDNESTFAPAARPSISAQNKADSKPDNDQSAPNGLFANEQSPQKPSSPTKQPSNIFSTLNIPAKSDSKNIFAKAAQMDMEQSARTNPSSITLPNASVSNGSTDLTRSQTSPTQQTSVTSPATTGFSSETQQAQFERLRRLMVLEAGFKNQVANLDPGSDMGKLATFYLNKRAEILGPVVQAGGRAGDKRKAVDDETSIPAEAPAKKTKSNAVEHVTQGTGATFVPSNLKPAIEEAGVNNKRKAQEQLSKADEENSSDTGKRVKPDGHVTYPALPPESPSKKESHTSSMVRQILQQSKNERVAGDGKSGHSEGPSTSGKSNMSETSTRSEPHQAPKFTFSQPGSTTPVGSPVKPSQPVPTGSSNLSTFKPSSGTTNATSSFGFKAPLFGNAPTANAASPTAPTVEASVAKSSFNFKAPQFGNTSNSTSRTFCAPLSDGTAAKSPFSLKAPQVGDSAKANSSTTNGPSSEVTASTSPFSFKAPQAGATAATQSNSASAAPSVPTFKPPQFGTGPVNFMSQFGKAAQENAEKEKAKRKAEDFDSEEEDEAEWERRDAEAQEAKRKKLQEETKGVRTKFIPGKGFVFEKDENVAPTKDVKENGSSAAPQGDHLQVLGSTTGFFGSKFKSPSASPPSSSNVSIFEQPTQLEPLKIRPDNIFGHLSDTESGAENSRAGDADDEGTDSGQEKSSVKARPNGASSLFFQSSSNAFQGSMFKTQSNGGFGQGQGLQGKSMFAAFGETSSESREAAAKPAGQGPSLFERISRAKDDTRPLPQSD